MNLDFDLMFFLKGEIITSFVLFVVFWFIYYSGKFLIRKQIRDTEKAHNVVVRYRNILTFMLLLLIAVVWIGELKTSILSAAAIFAAIIITFKEVILSFIGTILSNNNIELGDYVEYDGITGKVINRTFLNTTILINDTNQTQELFVPNLFFITNKIKKTSKIEEAHNVVIPISVTKMDDVYKNSHIAKAVAEDLLKKHYGDLSSFLDDVAKKNAFFTKDEDLVNIAYHLGDNKNIHFSISFVIPTNKGIDIKNKILEKYLVEVFKNKGEIKN